jgi:mannose-1-phosphate guanylyltransferase
MTDSVLKNISSEFSNRYVVIMAGGIGSRFWPESRQTKPKQFLDLLGTGKSLLQWTYERFLGICPRANIYFITNELYVEAVHEQIPEVSISNIISEPQRKNTAICAAYVSYKISCINPNANIILSPADHLILNEREFINSLNIALKASSSVDNLILTLGIKPTRPDTGYGYILYDSTSTASYSKVIEFKEKPSSEVAKEYYESGRYLWNSGLFVWTARTIILAFARFLPEIHNVFNSITSLYNTPFEKNAIAEIYKACPDISIDYGIIERADNLHVVPSAFGWSDLGTWESAFDNSEKDHLGNAIHGNHIIVIDATSCIIKAPKGKMVVVQGVDGLIIVDTTDALLICERNKEQYIKHYLNEVEKIGGKTFL